jgi:hypothetical protein
VFSLALSHFAEEVGADENKRILLVLDRAGWHTGKEVKPPGGIHLEFLPPSSPELQPAERLWPLTEEAVANRLFEEIEDLEESLVKRCVALCRPNLSSSAPTPTTIGGRRRREDALSFSRIWYELLVVQIWSHQAVPGR